MYGNRPGPYIFVNFIKGWGNKIKFFFKENGWIKFQFPTAEDRDRIMNGGPYLILGRRLFLKTLPSCFLYSKDETMLLPSWVQIFGFPAECWTTKALSKISSTVGKPLHTDNMTISKKGASYARVLVELDAKQDRVWEQVVVLPNGSNISIQFKYELDPQVCGKCNSLGHISYMCGVKETWKKYKRKPQVNEPEKEHPLVGSESSPDMNAEGQGKHTSETQNSDMHYNHIEDQHIATS